MKKIITSIVTLAIIAVMIMGIGYVQNYYSCEFTVSEVDENNGLMYYTDWQGEEYVWEIEEGEHFEKGDIIKAKMTENGTLEQPEDDYPVSIKVIGHK